MRAIEHYDLWEAKLILCDRIYDFHTYLPEFILSSDTCVELKAALPLDNINLLELVDNMGKAQLILCGKVYDFPIIEVHMENSLNCIVLKGKLPLEVFTIEIKEKDKEIEELKEEIENLKTIIETKSKALEEECRYIDKLEDLISKQHTQVLFSSDEDIKKLASKIEKILSKEQMVNYQY